MYALTAATLHPTAWLSSSVLVQMGSISVSFTVRSLLSRLAGIQHGRRYAPIHLVPALQYLPLVFRLALALL